MSTIADSSERKILLVPDSQARSKAIVKVGQTIAPGEVILRVPSLVTSLLPRWKGKRCDWCCRKNIQVKACSACKEVSYCSNDCQTRAWKAHHRRTCALLSRGFHLSTSFITEIPEQQANVDLLLNLWGTISLLFEEDVEDWTSDESDMDLQSLEKDLAHGFRSLMPHRNPRVLPNLPPSLVASHPGFLRAAWSRFDCNNFVLHNISSLETESGAYALGIFPLASRCFNHSCSPNAWSAFRLRGSQVWLEVRALQTIAAGTEITIPYLDSALPLQDRQLRLSQVYGFECLCPRCELEKQLSAPIPPPEERGLLEGTLSSSVFGNSTEDWQAITRGFHCLARLPSSIRHETFIRNLSEKFDSQKHDGPYEDTWFTGRALLAFCLLVYPENYPLTGGDTPLPVQWKTHVPIGYYALELAKACWNAHVLSPMSIWLQRTKGSLGFARRILEVVGGEEEDVTSAGLVTIETLESLIAKES